MCRAPALLTARSPWSFAPAGVPTCHSEAECYETTTSGSDARRSKRKRSLTGASEDSRWSTTPSTIATLLRGVIGSAGHQPPTPTSVSFASTKAASAVWNARFSVNVTECLSHSTSITRRRCRAARSTTACMIASAALEVAVAL